MSTDRQSINCSDCLVALDDYRRRQLSADEQHRIESHLENCTACRAALAEHERIGNALQYAAALPPGDPDFDLMRAAVLQELQSSHRRASYFSATPGNLFAVAAGVVVVLGLALLVSRGTWLPRPDVQREIASSAPTPVVSSSPQEAAGETYTPQAATGTVSTREQASSDEEVESTVAGPSPSLSPGTGESKQSLAAKPYGKPADTQTADTGNWHAARGEQQMAKLAQQPSVHERSAADPPDVTKISPAKAKFSRSRRHAEQHEIQRGSAPEAAVPAQPDEVASRQIRSSDRSRLPASASAMSQPAVTPTALYYEAPGATAPVADALSDYSNPKPLPSQTGTSATLQHLLEQADTARLNGNWRRALSSYEELARNAEGALRAEAQLRIADIVFEHLKDYTRAAHEYERLLEPAISTHLGGETLTEIRNRLSEARRLRDDATQTP